MLLRLKDLRPSPRGRLRNPNPFRRPPGPKANEALILELDLSVGLVRSPPER